MTGGSVAYYPFPDDGGAALHRVIAKLSAADRLGMTWQPTQDWLLEVPAALSIALSVNYVQRGVRRLDPSIRSGRLLVPATAVAAIQAVLEKRPNAALLWARIEGIEFSTARSRQAFEGALLVSLQ